MRGVGHAEAAPELGDVRVDGQDFVVELFDDEVEPGFEGAGLADIAAAADDFDAAAKLAYRKITDI